MPSFWELVDKRASQAALQVAGRVAQAQAYARDSRQSYSGQVISSDTDDGLVIELQTGDQITAYPGYRAARLNDKVSVVGSRIFS